MIAFVDLMLISVLNCQLWTLPGIISENKNIYGFAQC